MTLTPKLEAPYPTGVVLAVFGLSLAIGYLFHQGYAPLISLAGLACLPLFRPATWPRIGGALLLALVVWAAVTMAWSPFPNPVHRIGDLERITGLKLVVQALLYTSFVRAAADLPPRDARLAAIVITGVTAGLSVILLIESLSGAYLYWALNNWVGDPIIRYTAAIRSSLVGDSVVLLMWPAGLTLVRLGKARWLTLMAVAVAASRFGLSADAQLAALVIGVMAWGLWLTLGRRLLWLAMPVSWFYWLVSPMLMFLVSRSSAYMVVEAHAPPSWAARLKVWSFASQRMAEKPLFGWGLDASRTWKHIIPLHTHDAALQIWLELGVVGGLLMAGLWTWMLWLVAKTDEDRPYAAAAFAGLVTFTFVGAVSFGVWQEWWIALGAMTFAAFLVVRRWRSSDL